MFGSVWIQDGVNLLTAVLLILLGEGVRRGFNKHDAKLEELKQQEAEQEAAKEERLARMERTLNRHTRSLSALARANRVTVDTVARHGEDLEELEDVTEQLQTATRVNRERIEKSEQFIAEMREQRLRRAT